MTRHHFCSGNGSVELMLRSVLEMTLPGLCQCWLGRDWHVHPENTGIASTSVVRVPHGLTKPNYHRRLQRVRLLSSRSLSQNRVPGSRIRSVLGRAHGPLSTIGTGQDRRPVVIISSISGKEVSMPEFEHTDHPCVHGTVNDRRARLSPD